MLIRIDVEKKRRNPRRESIKRINRKGEAEKKEEKIVNK